MSACNATGAEASRSGPRPGSSSSSTAGSPGRRRSQRPAEGRLAEEDEDEPEDDEASEAGEGGEGEESEDEDTGTVDGDAEARAAADPRGTRTFMLPSLFLNRPATVAHACLDTVAAVWSAAAVPHVAAALYRPPVNHASEPTRTLSLTRCGSTTRTLLASLGPRAPIA